MHPREHCGHFFVLFGQIRGGFKIEGSKFVLVISIKNSANVTHYVEVFLPECRRDPQRGHGGNVPLFNLSLSLRDF